MCVGGGVEGGISKWNQGKTTCGQSLKINNCD